MSFYGSSFSFDGVSCEEYGLMLYDFGSTTHGNSEYASMEIHEDRIPGRTRSLFYGTSYETPLEFKLVFGANEDSVAHDEPIDRYEMQAISSWLTGHKEYKWLVIDEADMTDYRYRCIITDLKTIEVGMYKWAFECIVHCDSPYAYMTPTTFTYEVFGSKDVTLYNPSSINGLYCPTITYQANPSGQIFSTPISIPRGRMKGDIDGDGHITQADITLLKQHFYAIDNPVGTVVDHVMGTATCNCQFIDEYSYIHNLSEFLNQYYRDLEAVRLRGREHNWSIDSSLNDADYGFQGDAMTDTKAVACHAQHRYEIIARSTSTSPLVDDISIWAADINGSGTLYEDDLIALRENNIPHVDYYNNWLWDATREMYYCDVAVEGLLSSHGVLVVCDTEETHWKGIASAYDGFVRIYAEACPPSMISAVIYYQPHGEQYGSITNDKSAVEDLTKISIMNSSINKERFLVNAVANGDTIIINSDLCLLSSERGDNVYAKCNFSFPALKCGNNYLTLHGNGTYTFVCEFPVDVGG